MHSGKNFQKFGQAWHTHFAADCTEQKLSSSESYYLTPNLWSRIAARFVALLFSKTSIWGPFGVCPTSLYVRTIRFSTFCQSLSSVRSVSSTLRGHAAAVVPMFRALIMITSADRHGSMALRSEILCMPFFNLFDVFNISKSSHRFHLQEQKERWCDRPFLAKNNLLPILVIQRRQDTHPKNWNYAL